MPFDGSVPWGTYKLQFDTAANMNHWGEQDKAAHLAISLRGPATGVLTSLDIERLARLAYPDAPASMIEALVKDQIFDALSEKDLRVKVHQSRPPTLPPPSPSPECQFFEKLHVQVCHNSRDGRTHCCTHLLLIEVPSVAKVG